MSSNRLEKVIGKDEYRTCKKCGRTRNFTEAPECPRCEWGASRRYKEHKEKEEKF